MYAKGCILLNDIDVADIRTRDLKELICHEDHIIMFVLEVYLEREGLFKNEVLKRLECFSNALAVKRERSTNLILNSVNAENITDSLRKIHFLGEKFFEDSPELVQEVALLEQNCD